MADAMPRSQQTEDTVRNVSDRLMVLVGQTVIEEIERAEQDGQDIVAWQFGALDALTKQVAGAITACVTMVRRLGLSQQEFVKLRQEIHRQLEPAVLELLNAELARRGGKTLPPWPTEEKRSGRA
jgi:hypothetical protein